MPVRTITDIPARIRALYDIDDAEDLDASVARLATDTDEIVLIARAAADSLLNTHADTGIDLTRAPEWLALVRLVYPRLTIEGTGGGPGVYRTGTETGWYSVTGR